MKNIVICFDGTWNTADVQFPTNVVALEGARPAIAFATAAKLRLALDHSVQAAQ